MEVDLDVSEEFAEKIQHSVSKSCTNSFQTSIPQITSAAADTSTAAGASASKVESSSSMTFIHLPSEQLPVPLEPSSDSEGSIICRINLPSGAAGNLPTPSELLL